MKDREFATVARFASMEQAQVVKAMLDSMGVDNQIVNDIAADILPAGAGRTDYRQHFRSPQGQTADEGQIRSGEFQNRLEREVVAVGCPGGFVSRDGR